MFIRTARPGIVIGRKGAEVDRLRKDIERYTKKRVDVKVEDMNQAASESRPETDAALLAQGVAEQLAGRVAFRRAMRRAVQTAMRSGALVVRVACGGRLGGAEMGRREWYREGRVRCTPSARRSTSARPRRKTTFGVVGVKVWVYHGDEIATPRAADGARPGPRARHRQQVETPAAAAPRKPRRPPGRRPPQLEATGADRAAAEEPAEAPERGAGRGRSRPPAAEAPPKEGEA